MKKLLNKIKLINAMAIVYAITSSQSFAQTNGNMSVSVVKPSEQIELQLDPANVLKTNGVLTITDGSSFYVFRTNGTFSSSPVDSFSGRTFHGTWTADFSSAVSKFTVIAQMGWMNGVSSSDEYRKIVFFIYKGREKPSKTNYRYSPTKMIFNCYFIIDELVKIPKPDDEQK